MITNRKKPQFKIILNFEKKSDVLLAPRSYGRTSLVKSVAHRFDLSDLMDTQLNKYSPFKWI